MHQELINRYILGHTLHNSELEEASKNRPCSLWPPDRLVSTLYDTVKAYASHCGHVLFLLDPLIPEHDATPVTEGRLQQVRLCDCFRHRMLWQIRGKFGPGMRLCTA